MHHHVVLQLLDAAAELDQPGADRGIGDALQVARDQLVGQAQPGRDGAQVVLHEGRVGVVLGRVREADVGAGRQRDQAAGLHAHGQRAAGVGAGKPARRAVGIGDEAGEQRRDLGLHQRGVLELVELVQPQQHRREPGDPAQLARGERLEQMQAIGGGDADRVHAEGPERIARAGGRHPVGDPATGRVELDAGADARPAADLAMQVQRHLLAIQKLDVEGNGGGVAGHAQPGEALAALDHRAHGHGLQPVEIRQPVRGGVIGPAQPERLQPLAHRPVGMGGLRLDPGADDIADQAVHRRRDPRVVPRIPPGPPRRRGRARQDRRVQPIDRPRALPTPPTTRSVEAAARKAEKAMEEGPHAADSRATRVSRLLGTFWTVWLNEELIRKVSVERVGDPPGTARNATLQSSLFIHADRMTGFVADFTPMRCCFSLLRPSPPPPRSACSPMLISPCRAAWA